MQRPQPPVSLNISQVLCRSSSRTTYGVSTHNLYASFYNNMVVSPYINVLLKGLHGGTLSIHGDDEALRFSAPT